MADPITVTCGAACTVTVVHELSLPPLQLSADEGAAIAIAILAVWCVGWAFRMLLITISDGAKTSTEES